MLVMAALPSTRQKKSDNDKTTNRDKKLLRYVKEILFACYIQGLIVCLFLGIIHQP